MNTSFKDEILRKLIHLSSIWMVIFIGYFGQEISIAFFAGLLFLFTAFEYVRMNDNLISRFTNRYFSSIMRGHEQKTSFDFRALTGSFYFILAVLISVILFPAHIAMTGITVMIFSDTIAALIGKSVGRYSIPYTGKTIEGSLAFFVTTFIILEIMNPMSIATMIVIALFATVIELISNKIHINDNLSIVMTICGLIYLIG